MAGTRYVVDIDMVLSGSPSAKMQTIGHDAKKLQSEMYRVGQKWLDGFTGVAEKIGGKLLTLGKVGVAAAVGGISYGVGKLNTELQTTQISLAAILNAKGMTSSIESGMSVAAGWMAQMRKDARDLPGEFEDLKGIVASAAGSAFEAGMGVNSFEKMAAQAMAAGKSMAVPLDQAGRELAQLLEGRAGMHNVFGQRLGIHAQAFNDKTSEERVKILTNALDKFEPAIKVFGESFDSQSSAFIDNAKQFIVAATGPLFGRITGSLKDANQWFDDNQTTVKFYADNIGFALVKAFDKGKAVFLEYGPLLLDFGGRAYDKLVRLWQDAEPYVKSIGGEIKSFLKDDGSFGKIESILKLYIAAKVGGGALSIGKDVLSLASAARGAGLFGGGASAVGATAGAAGGIGNTGAAMFGLDAVLQSGVVAGAGMAGTIGAVVLASTAAIASTAYEIWYARRGQYSEVNAVGGGAYGHSEGAKKYVDELTERGIAAGRAMGDVTDASLQVPVGFSAATDAAQEFAFIIKTLAKSGDYDAINKINMATEKPWEGVERTAFAAAFNTFDMAAAAQKDKDLEAERKKKALADRATMTIHKVEITVSSNQAPNQIARDVMAEIANTRRYRPSSPRTFDFSAGR